MSIMFRNRGAAAIVAGSLSLVVFLSAGSQACAWGSDRGHDRGSDSGRGSDHDRGGDRHGFDSFYTPHYFPHGHVLSALPHDHLRLFLGGLEYFFWEGMFYRWSERQYVVVPAPVGAVVTGIPAGCQPVIVEGVPYYTVNGTTYMYTSYGYQVVPPPNVIVIKEGAAAAPIITPAPVAPAVAAAATTNADDAFTINLPNAKGGYTAVTLRRSGTGFLGPQGEYYAAFPRVEQLKAMYAK